MRMRTISKIDDWFEKGHFDLIFILQWRDITLIQWEREREREREGECERERERERMILNRLGSITLGLP